MPAETHKGSYREFLRRHECESAKAVRGTRSEQAAFAAQLFRRTADNRNLKHAIDYLASEAGSAPGPNGLQFEDLDIDERWELARALGKCISAGNYGPGPDRVVEIPKASGRGTRALRLQNIEDRVVQRAIVQILQPFLDPTFATTSYGFRPGRGREDALAMAEHLSTKEGRWIWILDDIRDAFDQVPHQRLLDILRRRQLPGELLELVRVVIGNGTGRGLRQGGSLSPLLLNVYLDHLLDRPWVEQMPGCLLIRYADDLLVLVSDERQAIDADTCLRKRLLAAGMPLKGNTKTSVHNLETTEPVEWLGFRIRKEGTGVAVFPAERSWNGLTDGLEQAHTKPESPIRAIETIEGWVGQMGPCRMFLDIPAFFGRIATLASGLAFDEVPSLERIVELLNDAYGRWEHIRKRAQEPEPGR
ncbi:MAG: reverse transcriptase domain-containing protein [Isosphaeraceae bacterium]